MTDAREARRAAEKAARDRLAGPLINAAGELGVAAAQRQTAAAHVAQVQQRAREHVQRAQQEAEQMLADAHAQVTAADTEYRRAHTAALTAGWSAGALHDMGYTAPPAAKRTRTTPAAPAPPNSDAPNPDAPSPPGPDVADAPHDAQPNVPPHAQVA